MLRRDPESSVWVSASAGTGKTRVLSNRLLRPAAAWRRSGLHPLPDLYKAGAAEMARRVQDDLADFAVMPKERLEGGARWASRPAADGGGNREGRRRAARRARSAGGAFGS